MVHSDIGLLGWFNLVLTVVLSKPKLYMGMGSWNKNQ